MTNIPPNQSVCLTVYSDNKSILDCTRRTAPSRRDDDSIVLTLQSPIDEQRFEIALTLEETESFCDRAIAIVDDTKQEPIAGAVEIHVEVGDVPCTFCIDVPKPDDEVAIVSISRRGEAITQGILRPVLHRFLVGLVDAMCDDLEDDD